MSGKYEKSRFVGVRRTKISEKRLSPRGGKSKISENQLSPARENQKSAKISYLPRGKIRNHQKSAFLHGGKSKISEKQLSPARENKKSAKNGFPPRGKIKKRRWLHFLLLRKTKNPEKFDEITFGGGAVHILHTLFRYLSIWQLLFSLLLLFGDDLVFRGRHAIAGSKATVESGTGIEA